MKIKDTHAGEQFANELGFLQIDIQERLDFLEDAINGDEELLQQYYYIRANMKNLEKIAYEQQQEIYVDLKTESES